MKRFKVALSFTGAHRIFLEQVARILASAFEEAKVLYDHFHQAELARPDLDVYLPRLYHDESELIVIFLCRDYKDKRWCKLEWRSVRQMLPSSDSSRIMLCSFDEFSGGIPDLGISPGDGYYPIKDQKADKVAEAILERYRIESARNLRKMEDAAANVSTPLLDEWPSSVQQFQVRNVEFAVVHHPTQTLDREYVLPVANGCLVGDDYVLTCKEAIRLAFDVAKDKQGQVVLLLGLVWYDFEAEAVNESSGLVLCKLTKRNEETWQQAFDMKTRYSLKWWDEPPRNQQIRFTIAPFVGQECGFIVPCEDKANFRHAEFTNVEFGKSWISYFRKPTDDALKSFVTGVHSGHIAKIGGAVFSKDGILLGILSAVTKREYDSGERAVVRSLLGHPRYTKIER